MGANSDVPPPRVESVTLTNGVTVKLTGRVRDIVTHFVMMRELFDAAYFRGKVITNIASDSMLQTVELEH